MRKRILFVDDEKSVLAAFAEIFADDDCEILVAGSGKEALKLMENKQVDLLLSDLNMPHMRGQQLLAQVKKLYPAVGRMLASGANDENEVMKSIISGLCSTFLLKPWEPQAVRTVILQVLATKERFHNEELLRMINQMENLSTLVGIYNAVNQLIEKEAGMQAIAGVIQADPAVTAAILRVANSAYSNLKTASLTQAISYLGLYIIRDTVLSCMFKSINTHSALLNIAVLTRQANFTNIYVGKIYEKLLKKRLPEGYATAGLLHSLGLIMGLHYFPEKYAGIIRNYIKQPEKSFIEHEKEQAVISNQDIGGYLLCWWGIPYPIVEAALYYHDPLHSAVIHKELVSVVHIASHYAWKVVRVNVLELDEAVLAFLGVEKNVCHRTLLPEGS
jgi:HD-like signal output (HDOD) protein